VPKLRDLPRVVFVLGKGGVGRSTVSTSLAALLASRGERVLVFEWTLEETIGPWFGQPPAGIEPQAVSDKLWVANFGLADSLRAYFVDHLGMGAFYRHVIHGRAVRRLVEAAPGIAEMMFLGHVCWLSTLAAKEKGLEFDRVIVDTPAAGHGAALLDLPATLGSMHASGLLGSEITRLGQMMSDPAWTGALAVSLPEELAVEETLELVPKATKSLGRPLLAVVLNRSAGQLRDEANPAWLGALGGGVPEDVAGALHAVHDDLRGRLHFEAELRRALEGTTERGFVSLEEQLGLGGDSSPRGVVSALASALEARLGGTR